MRCVIESGPFELVEVGLLQIEKVEEQIAEIRRTIRFHFQANGVAAAGTPQFLLDRAQEVLRFFLVDVEIAVAGDAKGVDAVENQAGEKLGDVMFDERGEVNVIPGLVIALAARHQNQPRYHSRHLHNGEQRFATLMGPCAHQQVVALVQQLRKRMAGVDRQRRQHRKNFLLEIALGPGSAFSG